MKYATIARLAGIGVLLIVLGCPTPPVPEPGLTITADDNGKIVGAAVSENILLRLASNATTGYRWFLQPFDEALLENTGHEYIPQTVKQAGAGKYEQWNFVTLAEGTVFLRLEYRRPDESASTPPAEAFEVTIAVVANGLTLTDEDNGAAVTVGMPTRIVATVSAHPMTGYQWQYIPVDDGVLQYLREVYVPDPCPAGTEGCGGQDTFEFLTQAAGATTLRLEYRRPWEPRQTPPAETFEVSVTVSATEVQLDEQANGKTVTVHAGSDILVTLAANPTTGYEWRLRPYSESVLQNTEHVYVAGPCAPGTPGCGGQEHWVFTALVPGATALRFEYRQPSLPNSEPAQTVNVTITVVAAS